MRLWLDTETFNEVPISYGTYRYTSTCELLIASWAIGDGEVRVWDRTADHATPADLLEAIHSADEIWAHNAAFDRNVLKYSLKLDTPIERWRCMMVRAMAHALPGGLDLLCDVAEVSEENRKHKDGKALVRLFTMPRPKNMRLRRATRETHPEQWEKFLAYAGGDIRAMRELDKKIPQWNYRASPLAPSGQPWKDAGWQETELYFRDQYINGRGFLVDVDLANAAVRAVARAKESLAGRTQDLTNGAVESATKRDQLLAHILEEHGVMLPDMRASTLERRIDDPNLPAGLRELLAVRLQSSSTSTTKYLALLNGVMPDNYLRGTLQFNGASRTRRWAGRTFQPHNLPSKGLPPQDVIDLGIEAMLADTEDLVFDDVMGIASAAVRGCIVAPPGKKIVVADLANIEGRDAAWLAGEDWKIKAFEDYDTVAGEDGRWYTGPELYALWRDRQYPNLQLDAKGESITKGPDLYKLAYAKSFRIQHEKVTKPQRAVGKVQELQSQYEGGVGAYVTGALNYSIDLEELAEAAWPTLPEATVAEAKNFYEWVLKEKRNTFGLSEKAFITCDSLKRLWRAATSQISGYWPELKDTAIEAIESPGKTLKCRRVAMRRDGAWLRVVMPSGRCLCYMSPRVEGSDRDARITYMGINNYTRQWQRLGTYGGKLFENICQSFAGDILKANMGHIEDAGYEIVLSVHDELVCYAPDTDQYTAEHLAALMARVPEWAPGMPLAAAGFECYRYRKE